MLGFVVVVAINVLNLALGYALAVYLGVAPPTMAAAYKAFLSFLPFRRRKSRDKALQAMAADQQAEQPTLISPPVGQPVVPPAEPVSENLPESKDSQKETKPINIESFQESVAAFASSLSKFAHELDKSTKDLHVSSGWTLVEELRQLCQPYLDNLQKAVEQLDSEISEDVSTIVLEQIAQLETTLNNLHYMDFAAGVPAAIERLSQEAAHTLVMAELLQKSLQFLPSDVAPESVGESSQSVELEAALSR